MANCVARDVEQIERAISKIIESFETSNFERGRKGNFMQVVVPVCNLSMCTRVGLEKLAQSITAGLTCNLFPIMPSPDSQDNQGGGSL